MCIPSFELELALLTASVRRSRTQLEALLDPGFREVGASGRLWTREEILADMVDDFLDRPRGRAAHRSSLWRCVGGGWRMLHHQGALLSMPA